MKMPTNLSPTAAEVLAAADELTARLSPVVDMARLPWGKAAHVVNPTIYARPNYAAYLRRAASGPRVGLILGMNPGPHGMTQSGVPFGDVDTARGILGGIDYASPRPAIHFAGWSYNGFDHSRPESSGQRLWGALQSFAATQNQVAGNIGHVLDRVLVLNYCPLFMLDSDGGNVTPSDLPKTDPRTRELVAACDAHLLRVFKAIGPRVVLALGRYAEAAARRTLVGFPVKITTATHPSPRNGSGQAWLSEAGPALAEVLG